MLWITLWNGMFSVTISLWIIITCLVILFFSQAVRTYNRSEYGLTSQRLYHGLQYFCGGSESSLALCSRTTRYSCVYGSKYSNEAQVSIACSNTGTERERERATHSSTCIYWEWNMYDTSIQWNLTIMRGERQMVIWIQIIHVFNVYRERYSHITDTISVSLKKYRI